MNLEKKNLPESVYTKLKNVALTKNRPTQEVLRYYAMEKFLYRLSASKHKNSFFLKGGLMLMVWDPATHRATVDIGFSDKIFPKPANLDYPTLLDYPSPQLQGYTPETMIAEKLDAMIRLGLANSRMKDFYDVWTMVNQFQIKPEKIAPVIREVFQNRKTTVRESPKAFSEAFYNTPKTLERWDSFLKGIGHDPVPLETVIFEIRDFFLPILPVNFE